MTDMMRWALLCAVLLPWMLPAWAQQESAQPTTVDGGTQLPNTPALKLDITRAAVRGMVRDAATGQGIARVLVTLEGDADTATLTDGEGRFELADVLVGPQSFVLRKPGYKDRITGTPGNEGGASESHNVIVAAAMPELIFTMARSAVLGGVVRFDSGEPAEGISVHLARRAMENGRFVWQMGNAAKTRTDGSFRIAALDAGVYALYTDHHLEQNDDPTQDGDRTTQPQMPVWGYAAIYAPSARDAGEVQPITLTSGDEQQNNITLIRERFQPVTVSIAGGSAAKAFQATVEDAAGRALPYTAQYDVATRSLHLMLPDGSYHLAIVSPRSVPANDAACFEGAVELQVAGKPVQMHANVVPQLALPVQVVVQHHTASTTPRIHISLIATMARGWIDDSELQLFAEGSTSTESFGGWLDAGRYWLHTLLNGRGLCVASLTAGSMNLAREPLAVALGGSTQPLTLTLRDDCAKLTLALPEGLRTLSIGEESFYTVYAVPQFDSTADLQPLTLRPSSGGVATLEDLSPSNYRIYVFAGAHALEYRKPEALPSTGQEIQLAPGATRELVVEVPQP
jgi:hypothetical protein